MTGKTMYVDLELRHGGFGAGLTKSAAQLTAWGTNVDRQMGRLAGWAETNRAELQSLGTGFRNFSLVTGAALGLSTKFAMDWQQSWTSVVKTVDASPMQFDQLESDLRDLTKLLPSTHGEIAEVASAAGQLGVHVDDIAAFTETMINLGVSTNMSADEAATALARFNNIMGLANADVETLGSVLVDLGNNYATTEGEIMAMSSRLAASGRIAGLTADEIMGYAAALTSVGVEAESGGTAMSKVFTTVREAAIDGGSQLDTFASTAGITADEFARMAKEDPTDAINAFVLGLARMSDEGQSTTEVFKELGMNDQRLKRAVLSMGQAGELTADALAHANKALSENTALADEASKFNETAAARMKRSWNGIKDNLIDVGETALPVIADMSGLVDTLTGVFGMLPDAAHSTMFAMLALATGFGLTVWAGTRVIGMVGSVRANLAFLQVEAKRAAVAMAQMNKAAAFGRLGKGAAALTGLAIAASSLGDGFEGANTASFALMGVMGGPLGVAAGAAIGAFLDLRSSSKKAAEALAETRQALLSMSFAEQADGIADLNEQIAALESHGFFGDQADDLRDVVDEVDSYRMSVQLLEDQTLGARDGVNELFDPTRMQRFVDQAGPILEELGYDLEKILAEGPQGDTWDTAVEAIRKWRTETDTAEGRAAALAASMDGLDDSLLSTADSAGEFASKLEALFRPQMDYDEALMRWKESVADLREELEDGSKSLSRNTEDGRANRRAINDSVESLHRQLEAAAAAGEGSEVLAEKLKDGRQSILDTAEAAGFNAEKVAGMLDTYGLTPELIKTLLEVEGTEAAKEDVAAFHESLSTVLGQVWPFSVDADTDDAQARLENIEDFKALLSPGIKMPVSVPGYESAMTKLNSLKTAISILPGGGSISSAITIMQQLSGAQARGGFYPHGVPAAANGLYRPAPSMARAGSPRLMWGEPETQGESFIPHAMDRRGKSTKILSDTAAIFGYDLSPRGRERVSGGVTIVNRHEAPLVGALTVQANSRREADEAMESVEYHLRRMSRGGRWSR